MYYELRSLPVNLVRNDILVSYHGLFTPYRFILERTSVVTGRLYRTCVYDYGGIYNIYQCFLKAAFLFKTKKVKDGHRIRW